MTRTESAEAIVTELAERGIQLYVDDVGELRFRATAGALTDADRMVVGERRPEIVALLEIQAEHELSDLQQAYLFGRTALLDLAGIPALYYLELSARNIEVARLERALNKLIVGHAGLRGFVEGDTRMRIYSSRRYTIPVHERESAEDETLREEMMRAPRNPARWPLFDFRVSRHKGESDKLHMAIDLLLLDAFSAFSFIRQWLETYQDDVDDPHFPSLQPWELRELVVEDEDDRRWWQDRLDHLPGSPSLPLVASPAEITRPTFQRVTGRLTASEWSRIKAGAIAMGATPSALLCALFGEALEAWSGAEREMLITLTTFGRFGVHPEREMVLGEFTDLVLLDCPSRRGATSLPAYISETHERLREAVGHCQYSGSKLLRDLSRRRKLRGRLISPIVFTSMLFDDGTGSAGLSTPGFNYHYASSQTPQIALDYQVYEEQGELFMSWDYVPDLLGTELPRQAFDNSVAQLRRLATAGDDWAKIAPQPMMATPAGTTGHRLGESEAADGLDPTGMSVEALSAIVRDCWADVLGAPIPSDSASFFDIGGSSLQAVYLQSSLERRLEVDVPIVFLFDNPTVAAQAAGLAGEEAQEVVPRRFSDLRRRPSADRA